MHPFVGTVEEVPLSRAPLVKVISQVRFPKPLSFSEATIEATRRELAEKYPVARHQAGTVIVLSPEGVTEKTDPEKLWTMADPASTWKISLADNFISIETALYSSRTDFVHRLSELLGVVQKTYSPPVYDRIGIRYVNRIEDDADIENLEKLVHPIALAGLLVPHEGVDVVHSLCDSVFIDGKAKIRSRWGWLPAGAIIDPGLPAPARNHWLLDIDVFTDESDLFDHGAIAEQADQFAEKAYRLFRWLVTEEFIGYFGGV